MASSPFEFPVFTESNLGTHIAVSVSPGITAGDLKRKLGREHCLCFPNLGEIRVDALMVKRKSFFYHLPESLLVKDAFQGLKDCWFLRMVATQVGHVDMRAAPTTDISNAVEGREDGTQSINDTSVSSEIISVGGIITRYFSESDEQNIFDSQVESITDANEQANQSKDPQIQKLGETQSTINVDHTAIVEFSVEGSVHKKMNEPQRNEAHPFIASDLDQSKCTFAEDSNKHAKHDISASLVPGLACLEMGSTIRYDITNDHGSNQGNRDSNLVKSECNVETKISKSCSIIGISASAAIGPICGGKKRRRAASSVTVDTGTHQFQQDSDIGGFQCNFGTRINKKQIKIGMAAVVVRPIGLEKEGKNGLTDDIFDDSEDHHGLEDSSIEKSSGNVGSKISKKHVKIQMGLDMNGSTSVHDDASDGNGAFHGDHNSDMDKSECKIQAEICRKHHENGLSTFGATKLMGLDEQRKNAVSDNIAEDGGHQGNHVPDVKKSNCNFVSKISKKHGKSNMSVSTAMGLSCFDKNGRNPTSSDISHDYRSHEIHHDELFKPESNSCSRNLADNAPSIVKLQSTLPLLADLSIENPNNKLGRSDVGKRLLQAAKELGVSARKLKPLISMCRSTTSGLLDSTLLARHIVFEVNEGKD